MKNPIFNGRYSHFLRNENIRKPYNLDAMVSIFCIKLKNHRCDPKMNNKQIEW